MKNTGLIIKLLILLIVAVLALSSCDMLQDILGNTTGGAHEHKYTSVTTAPTCTEDGYTTYICGCGDEYTDDVIKALGHTEITVKGIEPTCTETGLSDLVYCSKCAQTLKEQTIEEKLDHTYSENVVKPTCTKKGYTKYTCECGSNYIDNYTSALGHTFKDGVCACGEKDPDYIPPSGGDTHTHSYTESITEPTCTEAGYTTYTCTECKHSYTDDAVDPLGHTEAIDAAVAPTCTTAGLTEGKHCTVCNAVTIKQNTIQATGHIFVDGKCSSCGIGGLDGGKFDYNDIPAWSGENYVTVNNNIPYFTEDEITDQSFEKYSPLDSLGRAQVAFASLGKDLMPTGTRPSISYKPTGWVQATYPSNIVPQGQIYNRSHLIAWSLAGEGNNELNLITGTPYFNQIGMQKFEPMLLDYIKETGNHVMYRVTPIYVGNDLVARGVLMEAWSVEDNGEGICFNVFMYNVQPGITINYATGENCQTPSDDPSDNPDGIAATLVTDISQLKEGDKIIIVAKGENYVMGALSSSGNNRVAIDITKDGSTVIVPKDAQVITLGKGAAAGTYSFDIGGKYLYAASSSANHLKEQTTLSANGSWSISISSNGTATIKASGSNTRNWLRYNNTNKLFSTYASGQQDVCIYVITE